MSLDPKTQIINFSPLSPSSLSPIQNARTHEVANMLPRILNRLSSRESESLSALSFYNENKAIKIFHLRNKYFRDDCFTTQ